MRLISNPFNQWAKKILLTWFVVSMYILFIWIFLCVCIKPNQGEKELRLEQAPWFGQEQSDLIQMLWVDTLHRCNFLSTKFPVFVIILTLSLNKVEILLDFETYPCG